MTRIIASSVSSNSPQSPKTNKRAKSKTSQTNNQNDNLVIVKKSETLFLEPVKVFRISKNPVTINELNLVAKLSRKHGYNDLKERKKTKGRTLNEFDRISLISLRDIAKWCNAKSELDGFKPCYYAGGNIFKSGEKISSIRSIDWNPKANGYRLATKAEWLHAIKGPGRQELENEEDSEETSSVVTSECVNKLGIVNDINFHEWIWEYYLNPQESLEISETIKYSWNSGPFREDAPEITSLQTQMRLANVGFRISRNYR
jgi:hypothetical protein